MGVEQEPVGQHLLAVLHEPNWRESGVANMAVFTTASSRKSGTTADGVRLDFRLCFTEM